MQRYTLKDSGFGRMLHTSEDGPWAEYYEAQAEIARLTAEVSSLMDAQAHYISLLTDSEGVADRLQAELERTNDVLESQAHVISDLRAKLDSAHNTAIEACKYDITGWGWLWTNESSGKEVMREIIADLDALKRPT